MFPNFPSSFLWELVKYYYTWVDYNPSCNNFSEFKSYDDTFNKNAGIYDLDKSLQYLKNKLDVAIKNISDDIEVEINF